VAIAGGRIAAVEAGITGDATDTIDARGKIVVPGLIDIHTHAGRGKDSPALALQDGVTGFVDAGSGGPDNIDEIAAVIRGGPQIGPGSGQRRDSHRLHRRRVDGHQPGQRLLGARGTLSTDWNTMSRATGVVDFPNVMSKLLMFGMPLAQVVACATTNAAKVFDAFGDRGTLNIGAPADIAIMELREGNFEFLDNYEGKRTGRQRLFPIATVLNGKRTPARA
jgi:predicted amidohydrolase